MTATVINLAAFRAETRETAEAYPAPEELASRPYAEVTRWAGADFDRLVAVAAARDRLSRPTCKRINLEVELKNIILVAFRFFEFLSQTRK